MDGKGPLPDSNKEILAWIGIGLVVALGFGFFTGLDSQVNYAVTAPADYLSLNQDVGSDAVVFGEEQVDLLNEVSARSLGFNPVSAERLYCGEIRNQNVANFRLADRISDSSVTTVSGSCSGNVDLFLHTHPDGSDRLSQEDKDLESTGIEYTCLQYQEISRSPLNKKLNGINCWKIVNNGASFEPVSVYVK